MNEQEIEKLDVDLEKLQEILDYRFKDISLLINALTHPSYANEMGPDFPDYERMEFLGDSVLGMIVAHNLYEKKDKAEGYLTRAKSHVVSAPMLSRQAEMLDLGSFLLLGKGEEKGKGREKESVLENAFEALVGAIYLDGGLEQARKFVLGVFRDIIDNYSDVQVRKKDHKSYLQEYLQAHKLPTPSYNIAREEGPAHDKTFTVELAINGKVEATGQGRSKKHAEQAAADQLINDLEKGKKIS
jgi:ribonuclease-3